MDFEVALHPGLEKSGTTSLQELFSSVQPRFVGISQNFQINPSKQILTNYRYKVLNQPPKWWFTKMGNEFLYKINIEFEKSLREHKGPLLISYENLLSHDFFLGSNSWSRSNGQEYWTPVDHLKVLIENTVLKDRSMNILITVRRQPEWLASLYAQRSDRIHNASQIDFELKVDEILRMNPIPPPLNLQALVSEIHEKIKPKSVRLLPLELFAQKEYLSEIESWLLSSTSLPINQFKYHSNIRKIEESTWRLRPKGTKLGRAFPKYGFISEKIKVNFLPKFHTYITMKDELASEILEALNETNRSVLDFAPIGLPGYFKN